MKISKGELSTCYHTVRYKSVVCILIYLDYSSYRSTTVERRIEEKTLSCFILPGKVPTGSAIRYPYCAVVSTVVSLPVL